ncbi:hypothetical protein ACP275_13G191100 [Erythranthe tilingii]
MSTGGDYSSQPRGFLTPPPTWRTRRCSPVMPGSEKKPLSKDCPFHIIHKVPSGDSPYVRAKHAQLIDKDPSRAISLFWAAINSGDRVDSALKDMAVVMKQLDRSDEAIEAIKSFRHLCPFESQESIDNILVELYKQSGRIEEEIEMLQVKLKQLEEGIAFGGKRTKMARSQGKKIHITVEKEYSRLLGNLGWAYMQQKDYKYAEEQYRKALSFESDKNKQCNLAVCLMHMNKLTEAKLLLQATSDNNGRIDETHVKSYERAYQILLEFESQQKSPSVKKRAVTDFPHEKRADSNNWRTNQCHQPNNMGQKEAYSQLKRPHETPCNRTIPKVPLTQPQRRSRMDGPTENGNGFSCRKLCFGSFVGSENGQSLVNQNVNYYSNVHPPSETPRIVPQFLEKRSSFNGGDWRKNSTVKLPLETKDQESDLPSESESSSTDCRKTKEETPDKNNTVQGYRKICGFSKCEHKNWADMVEEEEEGFNDENVDSNIIHETPKPLDPVEKLGQKIERIDLGSGYFTQPEKTALQTNQSTARRSLCFDQNQNSDTANLHCTSPLTTKVFNFEDQDIGTPSSQDLGSDKSIKRRNRLQVFRDITLVSEN